MTFEKRKQEGLKFIQEDNYKEAFEIFSQLFHERHNDIEVRETALFLFDRIIEGNYDFQPEKPEEYILRGVAKFYKSQLNESIEDFNTAIRLDAKQDYAYKCKAYSLMLLEKYDLAIKELHKAIEINEQGEYYDDIAENYSRMGIDEKAIPFHEKAIEKSPDDARLWYNYGVQLGNINRIEDAVVKLKKAVELDPHYDDAKHNLAYYNDLLKEL